MGTSRSRHREEIFEETLKTDAVGHLGRESITASAARNVSFISCLLSKYKCECDEDDVFPSALVARPRGRTQCSGSEKKNVTMRK